MLHIISNYIDICIVTILLLHGFTVPKPIKRRVAPQSRKCLLKASGKGCLLGYHINISLLKVL